MGGTTPAASTPARASSATRALRSGTPAGLAATRRLQLAAEQTGTLGVALRRWRRPAEAADFGQPTAAQTRWPVLLEGYVGVFFDDYRNELEKELLKLGVASTWVDVSTAMKSEDDITAMVEPFLGGDDPIFGKRTTLTLSDFFVAEKLQGIFL